MLLRNGWRDQPDCRRELGLPNRKQRREDAGRDVIRLHAREKDLREFIRNARGRRHMGDASHRYGSPDEAAFRVENVTLLREAPQRRRAVHAMRPGVVDDQRAGREPIHVDHIFDVRSADDDARLADLVGVSAAGAESRG